jgi:hypothetical protein
MSPGFDRVLEVLLALDVKLVVKSKAETTAASIAHLRDKDGGERAILTLAVVR